MIRYAAGIVGLIGGFVLGWKIAGRSQKCLG